MSSKATLSHPGLPGLVQAAGRDWSCLLHRVHQHLLNIIQLTKKRRFPDFKPGAALEQPPTAGTYGHGCFITHSRFVAGFSADLMKAAAVSRRRLLPWLRIYQGFGKPCSWCRERQSCHGYPSPQLQGGKAIASPLPPSAARGPVPVPSRPLLTRCLAASLPCS